MPGILRVGIDQAGGMITGALCPKVLVNGFPIVTVGSSIMIHGLGSHMAATMMQGSTKVFACGMPVCRAGDAATCDHKGSPGSINVIAN